MAYYVTEFRPLAETPKGQVAIQAHNLPPFIDASCRREPDLQSKFPSITALCREGRLAVRLREGDVVAYITKDFSYPPKAESTRRMVAVLRVYQSWLEHRPHRGLEAHAQAAEWYCKQGLPLPSNCMVEGNEPCALDYTDHYGIRGNITTLEEWDRGYRLRAIECGAFHACKVIFRELHESPRMKGYQLFRLFGRIPDPRHPTPVAEADFNRLLEVLRDGHGN